MCLEEAKQFKHIIIDMTWCSDQLKQISVGIVLQVFMHFCIYLSIYFTLGFETKSNRVALDAWNYDVKLLGMQASSHLKDLCPGQFLLSTRHILESTGKDSIEELS